LRGPRVIRPAQRRGRETLEDFPVRAVEHDRAFHLRLDRREVRVEVRLHDRLRRRTGWRRHRRRRRAGLCHGREILPASATPAAPTTATATAAASAIARRGRRYDDEHGTFNGTFGARRPRHRTHAQRLLKRLEYVRGRLIVLPALVIEVPGLELHVGE